VKVRGIDRYKRTAADTILPDGRNLNQELVRAGLAWWYRQYGCREMVLRDLEQEARAAKRGLWSDPKPVEPWEWMKAGAAARKSPKGLVVSRELCKRWFAL
jgi:endonuclease YncB( thermonuclease family)